MRWWDEMTEEEMVGWHHRLDGHEFEQAPGVGDDREVWHVAVHGVAKSQTQLWLNWFVDAIFSIRPTFSFLRGVQKSILYLCASIPSLKIGSSIPSF